ncbi:MAG: cytochrome C oxidase subunit IV family protein [Rhodocyclaceae bacterium]|nr:cytochrome C oxidase subunit IV family protein [Rhodocyclaceae bacterium]
MGHAESIWLVLISLTGAGAWLAESGHVGWPLTLTVAALIALKGRLVIDHYMELRWAPRRFRRALLAFVLIAAACAIVSHAVAKGM